ncbi:MAG: DUF302 domain-containing protein [Gammaproteobacteria bacterium]|nr:DUF302 domain-containing protein [Gammaproteobacteria bacterium]MBU1646395.1 DUF302 domain-containing protein [Gammaproteobacteria bacterium]MBU1970938.1 DUF302 domain-containing protein [Gammaproteobacteria bacterium]
MLLIRSGQDFEGAMLTLQNAITAQGYTLARVQRVDIGLEGRGYKTDKYRVVFYGKAAEMAALADKHPQLMPFLPLNIAIFAEGDQTLLSTNRPSVLGEFFPNSELKPVFERWEKDLLEILEKVRQAQ